MEEKMNESTHQRPGGDRMVDAPLVPIDLDYYIGELKREPAWINGPRNAITVFKSDRMRLVLIALHTGSELPRHTADGVISVHVLQGSLQFDTDRQSVDLVAGQLVTLHEQIPHRVYANEESIFLLTLSPTPSQQRENPDKPL